MSKYFFDRLRSNAKLNIVNNDHNNLRSICGSSMDIAGIYDLSISLEDNPESVMQLHRPTADRNLYFMHRFYCK
jgi:hypothetical protein